MIVKVCDHVSPRVRFLSDLTQKPQIVIPPLVEGQEAVLNCIAPGSCSGTPPTISWIWTRPEKIYSYISKNITSFMTEKLNPTAAIHRSTLTFSASAALHRTHIACKVSYRSNVSTEKTAALNLNSEYNFFFFLR